MSNINRRSFVKNTIKASAATSFALTNFPTIVPASVLGKNAPSNKIVVAVMGVNSRGAYLAQCYSQLENVEVAYICDVEDGAIKNGLAALKDAKRQPTAIKDIRELVKKKDFDALIKLGG